MSKSKIISRIMILLIFIILVIVLLLQLIRKREEINDPITLSADEVNISLEHVKEMEALNSKKDYLTIKNILSIYMQELNQKKSSYYGRDKDDNYVLIVEQKEINTSLYNVLSEEYINKKGITIENVQHFVYNIKENCSYVPINIEKKYENDNIKSYAIYGVIINSSDEKVTESYIILNIDEYRKTFSVEQLKNKEELNSTKVQNIVAIENKENNIYRDVSGKKDEELIKYYILSYKRLALAAPELVYEKLLDDEYKTKRFQSVENYKEYVEENKDYIISINVNQYVVEEQEGYTQYIAIDKKDKKYVFNVTTPSDYKILLDTYTKDIPQFLEEYNKANSMEKVGFNIQKCIDAINEKDYSYVYNKLDEEFKNNNYKTEESFITSIKEKLFNNNKVKSEVTSSHEGDIYIYNITVLDTENEENKQEMTVIMQLKEGTDFVMSFSYK